jgi:polyisoprenoid-binding protein YceI
MRHQVLETSRFSRIVYECTRGNANRTGESAYLATLNGKLSMHGVTRPQTITAQVSVLRDGFKATGGFTLKQTDYEIPLVSALGGAIRVKDELTFSFDLAAKKVE